MTRLTRSRETKDQTITRLRFERNHFKQYARVLQGIIDKYKRKFHNANWVAVCAVCVAVFSMGLQFSAMRWTAPEPAAHVVSNAEIDAMIARASIRLNNGSCSATVFYIEPAGEFAWALSAAHCVNRIESTVTYQTVGGQSGAARVKAVDRTVDMALLKLWAKDVEGVVPVPSALPTTGDWIGCGYPAGKGPNVKRLEFADQGQAEPGMSRNVFQVKAGTFTGGDSGGNVCRDLNLVGVISHSGRPRTDHLYCSQYQQLNTFLTQNRGVFGGKCNQWWCQPNVPLPPAPTPPIPPSNPGSTMPDREMSERIRQLEAELERLRQSPAQETPPLPDDEDDSPPAPRPPREDNTAAIQNLQQQINALKTQIAGLPSGGSAVKGDRGETGAKGDQGDRGLQGIQGIQGAKGDKGDPGPAGTVNVVIRDDRGTTYDTHPNVVSGSTVEVNLSRITRSQ